MKRALDFENVHRLNSNIFCLRNSFCLHTQCRHAVFLTDPAQYKCHFLALRELRENAAAFMSLKYQPSKDGCYIKLQKCEVKRLRQLSCWCSRMEDFLRQFSGRGIGMFKFQTSIVFSRLNTDFICLNSYPGTKKLFVCLCFTHKSHNSIGQIHLFPHSTSVRSSNLDNWNTHTMEARQLPQDMRSSNSTPPHTRAQFLQPHTQQKTQIFQANLPSMSFLESPQDTAVLPFSQESSKPFLRTQSH